MQTVVLPITSDTYVSSSAPDQNFSEEGYLFKGFETWSNSQFTNFVKFDTSKIPSGSLINSAIIKAYVTRKDSTMDSTITVNTILSEFDAGTVTYNTMPAIQPTEEYYDVTSSEVGSFIYIDITNTIQKFVNASEENYGIALTGEKTILSTLVFGSTEEVPQHMPEIMVCYDDVGPQPCEKNSLLATFSSTSCKSFSSGSNLILDALNPTGTNCDDISYNTETGEFTINTTGQYLLSWSFNLAYIQDDPHSGCLVSFFKRLMKKLFHLTCTPNDHIPNFIISLLKNGTKITLSGVTNNVKNAVVNGSIAIHASDGDVFTFVNHSMIPLSTGIAVNIVPSTTYLEDVFEGIGAWVNVVRLS